MLEKRREDLLQGQGVKTPFQIPIT
jgi:hypothetical protein